MSASTSLFQHYVFLNRSRFLFARYCADRLSGVISRNDLVDRLLELKQSSRQGDYGVMYDSIIDRLHKQPKSASELALRILCWLVMTRQILSVEGLQVAVSVKPNLRGLDPGDVPSAERLIDVCAGLVVIDKASNTVRLSHATAREYLLQTPGILPPDPDGYSSKPAEPTCPSMFSRPVHAQRRTTLEYGCHYILS